MPACFRLPIENDLDRFENCPRRAPDGPVRQIERAARRQNRQRGFSFHDNAKGAIADIDNAHWLFGAARQIAVTGQANIELVGTKTCDGAFGRTDS